MILKTMLTLETTKENRMYQFNIPINCSYDEIYAVLKEFRGEILELSKQAAEKAKEHADKIKKEEELLEKEEIKEESSEA